MKFIKWLLAILVGVVLLVTLYLTVFFDLNNFKPEIVDAVKKQTGREFVISEDLSWTFFPAIGINLGGVSLSNPQGFTPAAMLEVHEAVAEVALMPLFKREIEIAQLSLEGAKINLVTRKDGSSSLDGLSGEAAAKSQETPTASAPNAKLNSINIGGVSITNTQINVIDEAQQQTQTFTLTRFTLGAFSLDKFSPLAYEFTATLPDMTVNSEGKGELKLSQDFNQLTLKQLAIETEVEGGAIPNKKLNTEIALDAQIDLDKQNLTLDISKLLAADINASGKLAVNYAPKIAQISADFKLGDIDVDALLPASETVEQAKSTEQAASTNEPDLSALRGLDVKLKLAINSIKVANLSTQNWLLDASIKNGVMTLTQLNADLYGGKLTANASLDARQSVASYRFDKKITGVQVQALLKDAAEVDLLAGTANFSVSGSGKSLQPEPLKKNLLAKGQFEIADGAIYGVNIPQMIRGAQAKLTGDTSVDTKEERKTDFSSLTGTFSLAQGVATNPDLAMASPLLRLAGNGTANLLTEGLEYRLTTSLVKTLAGQGGEDKNALAGVDIPLLISGTFQEPKFSLDTQSLLNNQLKDETNKAKEKLKDSLMKKLGGF